jgi:hypothetical protein
MMQKAIHGLILLSVLMIGCDRVPTAHVLTPDESLSFELADASQGSYDWPVSPSGFAISRPPIFSSLIGIQDQPLEPIDLQEIPPQEKLEGDAWARFLRANNTNAKHPFQFKPIHEEIASIALENSQVSFVFSSDANTLYVSNGQSIQAIELPDDWRDRVPLEGTSAGKIQKVLWQSPIPNGSIGNSTLIAVSSIGKNVSNDFDFGIREVIEREKKNPTQEDENDDGSRESDPSDSSNESLLRSELVVVDSATTLRLDLDTGKVLASFPTPATGLDYLTAATDADVVLATNPEGEVFWNDGEAGKWLSVGTKVRPASQIDGHQSVSLNSKGDAFLAIDGNVPTTVWLSEKKKTTSVDSAMSLDQQAAAVVWADNGRNWFGESNVYYADSDTEVGATYDVKKCTPQMIRRPVSVWPQRAGRYSQYTSMTVLGLRRLQDGRSMWSLWDQSSYDGENSLASSVFEDTRLERSSLADRKRPTFAVSIDASRFAYLDPNSETLQIKVFYRNPWEAIGAKSPKVWIAEHITGNEEDRRDIARAAASLRAMPMDFYWGRPPEELCGLLIVQPASERLTTWDRRLKAARSSLEVMKKVRKEGSASSPKLIAKLSEEHRDLASWEESRYDDLIARYVQNVKDNQSWKEDGERWRKNGGMIAEVAYASHLYEAALSDNGADYQSGPDAAENFRKACVECDAQCRKILERPRPPVNAFLHLFVSAQGASRTPLSIEPEVRRFVKLYPECGASHINLGLYLLPANGGNIGDTGSYFQAAIANVNEPMREKTFGMTSIRLASSAVVGPGFFAYTGISEKRVFRGVSKMLDEEHIANLDWMGAIFLVATHGKNRAVLEQASSYYRQHFLYPWGNAYQGYPEIFSGCYQDRPVPR